MNRLRPILRFVFSGGLLIFLTPYLVYRAATNRLPWLVAIIAIPLYAMLSYGAFKLFWPRIISKSPIPPKPTAAKVNE